MQTKGLVCAILAQSFFYAAGAFAENVATAPISPDEPSLIETASCDEACEPSGGYSENLACGADPCNVPFWFAGSVDELEAIMYEPDAPILQLTPELVFTRLDDSHRKPRYEWKVA